MNKDEQIVITNFEEILMFCNKDFEKKFENLPTYKYSFILSKGGERTYRYFRNGEKNLEDKSAIYFIIDSNGKIFYIGQSVECLSRLKEHYRNKKLWGKNENIGNYKVKILFIKDTIPYPYIGLDSDIHLRLAVEGYLYAFLKSSGKDYYNHRLFKFQNKSLKELDEIKGKL